MSIKHTIPFLLALTACGSQQSPIERTEQVPDAIQLPVAVPTPAETITVDQDANATVAPGPVQPTPVPTVSSLPAPVATDTPQPVPTVTPTPTPSATPVCAQVKADGTNDYTCGLWILNPLSATGVCAAHAAELELTNQNGTWFNGTYPVTIDAQGNIAWGALTLSSNGSGEYDVQSTQAGRGATTVPCYFNAAPAN